VKIFFDTEFIEDGRTIDLISIGLVREDGAELYLESLEGCARLRELAGPEWEWLHKNVEPKLSGRLATVCGPRWWIADKVREFAGESPEFWAYYADYDWVALCQLYGRMIDLPAGWPKYCRDLKQVAGNIKLPKQDPATEHHALEDARWTREAYLWLAARPTVGAHLLERVRALMKRHNLKKDDLPGVINMSDARDVARKTLAGMKARAVLRDLLDELERGAPS